MCRQAFGWPSCWAESSLVLAELLGEMERFFGTYDTQPRDCVMYI